MKKQAKEARVWEVWEANDQYHDQFVVAFDGMAETCEHCGEILHFASEDRADSYIARQGKC